MDFKLYKDMPLMGKRLIFNFSDYQGSVLHEQHLHVHTSSVVVHVLNS